MAAEARERVAGCEAAEQDYLVRKAKVFVRRDHRVGDALAIVGLAAQPTQLLLPILLLGIEWF